MITNNLDRQTTIPVPIVLGIIAVCLLPLILNLIGVDFGSTSRPLPPGQTESIIIDDLFYRLSGAFTHTILEWSAFCAAIFIVFLSFAHYRVVKDITTPVIGVALFCAGCMDAFHTLAADRLIEAVADNTNLIPFTWAISRVFNALIMIIGVSLFLLRPRSELKAGLPFVLGVSTVFGLLAFVIIDYCASHPNLPQTMYPDSLITRPWDVGPLVLFIFAGLYIFPKFYKQHPSIFAYSLVVCAIPEIAIELHMAFGSTALFDNHFNIAHFLKIIAYLVPLIGLTLDYVQTYLSKEETSRESERLKNRFQQIFDNSPNALLIVNDKGEVKLANSMAISMFGYEDDELNSMPIEGLMPRSYRTHHPAQREAYMHEMNPRAMGAGRDLYGLRKNGLEFPVEIGLNPIESESLVLATITDVTERKHYEEHLRQQKEELERSNEQLEQFAYVASHDLQEPLRMVSSYTQLLAKRYKSQLDQDANDYIEYAVDGAVRMQTLIQDLLKFSRLNTHVQEFISVDTNDLYDYAIDNLAVAIDETGTVVTKDQLPFVQGDAGQLRQLFQNLIGNAVKYHDPEKMNQIHVSAEQLDGQWQFCIEDNGIGIEPKYYERIFVIFKRLHGKSEYKGTGIGLAICKKIIEKHHGKIWVESEFGQGTRFYFTLMNAES
jgi:PAS domain S-box-containing protein